MTTPTTAADWASARGEKWRLQLEGLEASLRAVDAPLIAALDVTAARRIADVGCGGGGTTLEVRRQAGPHPIVHGYDLSPVLIDVARHRAATLSLNATFAVADVAVVPPPDGPCDRLLSRFGTMFFEDPPAAFANLRRWLEPGGRFAFAVWGPLADNPWMTTIRDVVSFHHPGRWFDEAGTPVDEEGCSTAVEVMLDDLAWWGEALRRARKEQGR